MVYSYTGALMIQAHAAVTISSLVKNKMADPNTVVSEINFFTTEIQTVLDHEYGTGPDSIKSILDKRLYKNPSPLFINEASHLSSNFNAVPLRQPGQAKLFVTKITIVAGTIL